MKKISALFMSVVIAALSLSACSGEAQNSYVTATSDNTVSSVTTENVSESNEINSSNSKSSTTEITTENSTKASSSESKTESSAKASSPESKTESSAKASSPESKTESSIKASSDSKTENSTKTSAAENKTENSTKTSADESSRIKESNTSSQTSENTSSSEDSNIKTDTSVNSISDINLYNKLFDINNKINVEIKISQAELNKLQNDYNTYQAKRSKSPIYRMADVVITIDNKSYEIKEVGIRLKGNMSLSPVYDDNGNLNISHYKLSFNETFDDKQYYGNDAKVWASKDERKARKNRRFATLKKLDVKWNSVYDNTHIREYYAAEMFRQSGVLVQRQNLSQLTFNGSNYGVVKLYEPVDEIFLEKNLPESALGGDLYKCGWTMKPCNYKKNEVTYGVSDKDKGTKYNFDLKTNEKTSTHKDLKNLLDVLSSNPTPQKLEQVTDTNYLAKFLAASYFAGDPDDIRNNYNNHYVYFRKDNGKAFFIVYDNDRTLGITYGYNPDGAGMTSQSPYSNMAAGAHQNQANPLIKTAILTNGNIKDKFTSELKKIASYPLWQESSFNSVYETARSHYESVVVPSVSFANVKKDFKFSLEGKASKGDRFNMSFSDYAKKIMITYKNNVK